MVINSDTVANEVLDPAWGFQFTPSKKSSGAGQNAGVESKRPTCPLTASSLSGSGDEKRLVRWVSSGWQSEIMRRSGPVAPGPGGPWSHSYPAASTEEQP